MNNQKKNIWYILLILCSLGVESKIDIEVSEEKELLSQEIFEKITNEHFFIDKNVSNINSEIFRLLLKQLDSQKIYFTKYEVDSFKKEFRAFAVSYTHLTLPTILLV